MHKDENKDIDLIIRSMMTAAEEEVPAGVWESVSEGLDKAARRRTFIVWRRVATGVAAVAAAVAAFVMIAPVDKSDIPYSDIKVAEAPAIVQEALPERMDEALPENAAAESRNINRLAYADVPSPQTKDDVSIAEDEAPAAVPSEPVVEEVPSEPVRPAEQPAEDDEWSDPFAEIGGEEENTPVKIAVVGGGNLMSNGDPAATTGFLSHRLPGRGPVDTKIDQISKESTYSIPITVGAGVRFSFGNGWSLGTGVNYSRLERTFRGVYSEAHEGKVTKTVNGDIHNTVHYVGIPVNVYRDLFDGGNVDLYAYAGGAVEKGLVNSFRIQDKSGIIRHGERVKGAQLSANIGLGVRFALADNLGLYVDPGLTYYFDCDQPLSIRTQQNLMMSLAVGLRVDL